MSLYTSYLFKRKNENVTKKQISFRMENCHAEFVYR